MEYAKIMDTFIQLSRAWRWQMVGLILPYLHPSVACVHHKEVFILQDYDDINKTSVPKLYIDRELTLLTPAPRLINGEALVPLYAFSL